MVLGRGFSSGEDRLPVVVISARLWQRRFAGDPQIIGKTDHALGPVIHSCRRCAGIVS